jgi:hypothetical protein
MVSHCAAAVHGGGDWWLVSYMCCFGALLSATQRGSAGLLSKALAPDPKLSAAAVVLHLYGGLCYLRSVQELVKVVLPAAEIAAAGLCS